MRQYEIISTDSHLEVPPYVWEPYVDAEFRDIPDAEKRKIVCDNARSYFRLDRTEAGA